MVTLLNPKQNKPNTAYEEPESTQIAPVNHSQNSPAEPVGELAGLSQPLTGVESTSATSKKNFWASIARPLTGLRELLAGPPMTERDRRRQALTEAKAREATGVNWFYRTPF
jgi:hypothetical protein